MTSAIQPDTKATSIHPEVSQVASIAVYRPAVSMSVSVAPGVPSAGG